MEKKGMLRWDLSIYHQRWFHVPWGDWTQQPSHRALRACGHLHVCMSFMRVPQPSSAAVPLVCSILINPMMTEWLWQVMYVLGLGWEVVRREEHDSGVNAKPTQRHNTASSRSTLGQVLLLGSLANSLTTQSSRLSPQIRPTCPGWEKHMARVDFGKCYEFLMRTRKPNIYFYFSLLDYN